MGGRRSLRERGGHILCQLPAPAHSKTMSANVAEIPQIAPGGNELFAVIRMQPVVPESLS